jgi:hypothetical protein
MPFTVLFAGSVPGEDWRDDARRSLYESTCHSLGKAIAERGMHIVIGSADPDTPDRWILEGAASAGRKIRVWLVRPASEGPTDVGDLATRLDIVSKWVSGPWAAVSVAQLQRADAVLILGGRVHTRNLGYSGPTLGKAVLAIPWWGGAGQELWEALRETYSRVPSGADKMLAWSPKTPGTEKDVNDAVEALIRIQASRVFRLSRLHPLVVPSLVLVGTLVLFISWVAVFAYPDEIQRALKLPQGGPGRFFELLALAALLGTTLRNSLRFVLDPAPEVDSRRLLAEFVCGILLAFGLALLFLVGAITISGTPVEVLQEGEQKGGFERVAVVMTLLGLAGGLLIEQTADSLRRRLLSQIGDSPTGS